MTTEESVGKLLFEHDGQDGGQEDGSHGDLDGLRSVAAVTLAGADVGVVFLQNGLVAIDGFALGVIVLFVSTATNDPNITTNCKRKENVSFVSYATSSNALLLLPFSLYIAAFYRIA